MELIVRVPGSCGELAQGYADGEPFLITCPIDRCAEAVVKDDGLRCVDAGEKSRAALSKALQYLGVSHFPFSLYVTSELPAGKGMASSSADIGAVVVAAAAACGRSITEQEIACIAASIEPTDGVFCRGVVAINYQTGRIFHSFGVMPALAIAMFDLGGTVDTLAFHEQYDKAARMYGIDAAQIWPLLTMPYTAEALGDAATCSALAYQRVVCKPQLPELLETGKSLGAVGVNIGHSGTVCGLLFPENCLLEWLDDFVGPYIAERMAVAYIGATVLSSGGWTIERR